MTRLGRLVRTGVPERSFKLRLNDEKENIPDGGYYKDKDPEIHSCHRKE